MLSEIILKNFKAFGEIPQPIPCKQITLLFGENSSGKSSILKALMALKQTFEDYDPNSVLLYQGNIVDVGSYKDIIFGHNIEAQFEIGLKWEIESDIFSINLTYSSRQIREKRYVNIEKIQWIFPPEEDTKKPCKFSARLQSDMSDYSQEGKMIYNIESVEEFLRYGGKKFIDDLYVQLLAKLPLGISFLLPYEDKSYEYFINLTYEDEKSAQVIIQLIDKVSFELKKKISEFKIKLPFKEGELKQLPKNFPIEELKNFLSENFSIEKLIEYKRVLTYKSELDKFFKPSDIEFDLILHGFPPSGIKRDQLFPFINWAMNHLRISLIGNPIREGSVSVNSILSLEGEEDLRISMSYSPLTSFLTGFREYFLNIMPIGPLRESPLRYYIFRGSRPVNVGFTGSKTADLIYANMEKLTKMNKWLKEFKIGYKIDFGKELDTESGVYSLRFTDETTGHPVALPDIGFGVSQVLPIFVQTILSDISNETLLIEQPEIHLNPKLQAELGEFFAKAALETPDKQFIIETHSEHLILRLKKLIKNGVLSPEHISVVYIAKEKDGAKAIPIGINEKGEFTVEWPDAFFELAYKELFE